MGRGQTLCIIAPPDASAIRVFMSKPPIPETFAVSKKDPLTYKNLYKLGFSHLIFKDILGLKKPSKPLRWFYVALIFGILLLANALL